MQLSIKTNFPDVQRQLQALSDDIGKKATASALNKVVAQAKTAMSREITSEFEIKSKAVKERLVVDKAKASRKSFTLEASLSAISRRLGRRGLNIIQFDARKVANGVSIKIRKNGPRKTIRGAFIANRGRTVFIREGKKRLPIKALSTVDVKGMFNTKRINTKVVAMIEAKFPTIFANEARFFIERFRAAK